MCRYCRRLRRRRVTPGEVTVLAIGAAVVLGAAHTTVTRPATARPAAPAASSYTPGTWAAALLTAAGLPRTGCNLAAVAAWEHAEGGHWGNAARHNPLDTTQPEPGSRPMNQVGVQAYPSWRAGLQATVTTLRNGRYGPILSALAGGGDAQAVADAVAASPWGTGPFTVSC